MEPWQVLVKATTTGLVVMNTHEGEDVAGLHVSGHFFGRMAEWEKFTSSGYTAEHVEAVVAKVRAAIDNRANGWGKSGSEAGHQALNMLLRNLNGGEL